MNSEQKTFGKMKIIKESDLNISKEEFEQEITLAQQRALIREKIIQHMKASIR